MKDLIKKNLKLLLILFFFIPNLIKGQFNIPQYSKKIYPINDYAGILSNIQIKELNKKLIQYYKTTSTEILVAIIKDLYGEDPNLLASQWGEKWHIGQKYKNNGIIILLSIKDKKISIQNGYGIEPYITDYLTKHILQNIKPLLKKKLYYESINFSIKTIFKFLKNHFKNKKKHHQNSFLKWNFLIIFSLFLIFFLFYSLEIDAPLLLNTLFLTDFLFKKKYFQENEDNFDGFGGGGNFGGGGSSENWD
ncbi:TPM domain-containing protein [Blattabacterium cuenoti]|uniref:TPM domain-containing protein n=1 Tax=Blattabacterium cuenoti TaxID=1653831 RepID=UPI00163BCDED|nr:TPM domain-containing protein [Blattabacterium cuenoti]